MTFSEYAQHPETAEEAFEQQYQELSRLIACVFKKMTERHESKRTKNWADVGDLGHSIEIMRELDEFLRSVEHE